MGTNQYCFHWDSRVLPQCVCFCIFFSVLIRLSATLYILHSTFYLPASSPHLPHLITLHFTSPYFRTLVVRCSLFRCFAVSHFISQPPHGARHHGAHTRRRVPFVARARRSLAHRISSAAFATAIYVASSASSSSFASSSSVSASRRRRRHTW